MNKLSYIVAVLGLSASLPVFALEYSLLPTVEARATHNDNIRLTPDDPISLQGREVRTGLGSRVASETWQADLNVDLRFNSYNREEFDSDDQYVDLFLNKDTERMNFGIKGNLTRDSTRTSELESTGNIGVSAQRHESFLISPSWSYLVTDTNRISLDASVLQSDYEGNQYTDYDYDSVAISLFSVWSEQLTTQVRVGSTRYETELIPGSFGTEYFTESEGTEISVGGEYGISENLTISALVGSTETTQSYNVNDPFNSCTNPIYALFNITPGVCALEEYNDRNLTADTSLKYEGERSEFSMSYSILNKPSSRGYEVQSEEVRFDWKYQFAERTNFGFKVLYGKVEAVDVETSAIDPDSANRDFLNAGAVLGYRVTSTWRVFSNFEYRWQERDAYTDEGESYVIGLGVKYVPVRTVWSR